MNKTQRRWLLNRLMDGDRLIAAHDSRDDKMFQELEKSGAIKCYDAAFGNSYYAFTPAGRRDLLSSQDKTSDPSARPMSEKYTSNK